MNKQSVKGKRVDTIGNKILQPGEYGKLDDIWYVCPPQFFEDENVNMIGNLKGHAVIEHEDGSISVSPSILITMKCGKDIVKSWHGHLIKGVWFEG